MTVSTIACKVVLHASLQWMPTFGVVEMGIERIPAEGSDENRRESFFGMAAFDLLREGYETRQGAWESSYQAQRRMNRRL